MLQKGLREPQLNIIDNGSRSADLQIYKSLNLNCIVGNPHTRKSLTNIHSFADLQIYKSTPISSSYVCSIADLQIYKSTNF